jgi:ABC-type nitrate/sulfonate/bicarbonate transport system substrate-binding protein
MAGTDPVFADFLYELVYVRPDYAKQNPDIVRRFLAAMVQSVALTVDTPITEQMDQLRKRFGGVSDALLAETLTNVKPAFNKGGVIAPSTVDNAAKFLVDLGAVKVAAPFDKIATNEFLPKP